HEDDRPLGRPRAMHDALGHYEPLTRTQLHRAPFQIDEKATLHDVEKLILVIVLVPVVLALHDAEADDGIVHAAESLVVPAVFAGGDQRRHVDQFERGIALVQMRGVRVALRVRHATYSLCDRVLSCPCMLPWPRS